MPLYSFNSVFPREKYLCNAIAPSTWIKTRGHASQLHMLTAQGSLPQLDL